VVPAAKQWQAGGGATNSQLQAHRDLNRSATNIPSACKIVIIALNDAMILSYDATPSRMEFSEGTGHADLGLTINAYRAILDGSGSTPTTVELHPHNVPYGIFSPAQRRTIIIQQSQLIADPQ
jgi:hypothetical protein